MAPTDEELLVQYKQGDARAFRSLVQRYTTPIYSLALRLLADPMEAENVTQESFLRIVTALDRIRLDIPFKPYIFRIALNLCRDQGRKKQSILFSTLDRRSALYENDRESEPASEMIAEDAPPLWERLEKEEQASRLQSAIDALDPAYRTVIILRYVEEMSYDEIAQTCDLPLNTIRTHLRRAKDRLRRLMESELDVFPQARESRPADISADTVPE